MSKKLLTGVFVLACCLFAAPKPALAHGMRCYSGGTIMTQEGIPMCSVFESTGDCEYCEVPPQ